MSARPWMPLYIADYLADTGHLSTLEHGAYMLLIMHYWQNGGLPHDERRLVRICRMSPEEWAESREAIAELFDDGWRHKRIDAEISRARDVSGKRKAAAEQRHSKSNANAPAIAEQKHTQSQSHTQQEKEEPVGSSKKRASRLPSDWEPDIPFALSLGLSEGQALNEAQKFREWWPAQPGQKGVKADWGLTWKTWCRKAAERPPPRQATAPPGRRMNAVEAYLSMRSEPPDEPAGRTIDHRDDELLPADKPGLPRAVADLGEALRWPDGSGHH